VCLPDARPKRDAVSLRAKSYYQEILSLSGQKTKAATLRRESGLLVGNAIEIAALSLNCKVRASDYLVSARLLKHKCAAIPLNCEAVCGPLGRRLITGTE